MINKVIAKIFGTSNEREIKRIMPLVDAINALEPEMKQLSDEQLRAKTDEFRQRIRERVDAVEDADEKDRELAAALDEILPEAFAVVREAGWRVLKMRHFDVQLIGGVVLHQGKIAEMKTGEGKTLVATLPVYLNALSGRGVHVVTVNDYLAKRDSEWMGKLYTFLGLTVGVIVHDLDDNQRREAYGADVTYGTNNEFGFDYLRDNMKFDLRDCVQRGHNFSIVDEVDSILIDEARTPLIISGQSEESTDKYYRVNRIIPQLELGEEIDQGPGEDKILTGDYVVDEKHRTITVTDVGWEKVERLLGIGNIADPENWDLKHHVDTAIKAHALYRRDVEYVVKDGEVLIVDEFTGRLMPGRRWSDGLHQAVEAKEGVKIERENQTLATVTFQNYFRMYKKLAGMTGTAETEAAEFDKIYKLEVVVIPTNRDLLRIENSDVVYRTEKEKYFAAADEITEACRDRPAGAGGHNVGGEVGAPLRSAEEEGREARGAERQVSREGSRDCCPGRAQGRDHDCDQHGRARYRHSAGRQFRIHGQAGVHEEGTCAAASRLPPARSTPSLTIPTSRTSTTAATSTRCRPRSGTRSTPGTRTIPTSSMTKSRRSAGCSSSAPSATRRGALTTSCVDAPAARAIPAHRASICRWKMT